MFNPHARWDRPLPQEGSLPGEPIDVVVNFKQKRFYPVCFFFGNRKHIIKAVQFVWKEKKGRDLFYLFNITDEQESVYTMCFSSQSLRWRLIIEDGY
ncbi:MAG: hypothetical protein ABII88_07860 [Candidatus Omnitrophota bacterium]